MVQSRLVQARLVQAIGKNDKDLLFLHSLKHHKPDKKFDRKEMEYEWIKRVPKHTSVSDADPKYGWHTYDNCFNFLYENNIAHTKTLEYIDIRHEEYGYLCPITPSVMAKKLAVELPYIHDILHTLQRVGILFIYDHNIMRIYKLLMDKHIIKQMLTRHPSITKKKPLGYKAK